ncbi:MAG: DNA polymerase III subunit gamma/tau [Candidatus Thermofonsia Clade 1 bacterium]|uniref:DNA polymerase III subunit gamma/tau n=1 Tax=Candidatus Thermofonsia Clade 1 bacterium TaxID=2364210 RepID=A0A2M8PBN0_9CHLR|nr:MAG: DNA polymerase III subunit gamma/tau [Candidatus Thermofonsia Clade 1 bacterium]
MFPEVLLHEDSTAVSEQALYLKWRPRGFDEVIGQAHITRTLRNAIVQNRLRHAYLFNGPRGTGKTTMARILAKAVNCLHPEPSQRPCNQCRHCVAINEGRFLDLIEIDAASNNGVDDVRDLREKVAFAPAEGRYKVYIVDEVHRFSGAAFDALLKTLEEPPPYVIFVLATTELDRVPPTIRSRSLTFEFRRVALNDVVERLAKIAEAEGVYIERAALELVAQQGTGSVRDSISLLDQLIAAPSERITLEMAEQMLGTASHRLVSKLAQAIIENNPTDGLDVIASAIAEGADPAQFGRQIVEHLRQLLLTCVGGAHLVETSDERRALLAAQAAQTSREVLLRAIRAFSGALSEVRGGWQPQLPLELALIESTRPLPVESAPVAPQAAAKPARAAPSATPVAEEPTAPDGAPSSAATLTLSKVRAVWASVVAQIDQAFRPLGALLQKAQAMPHRVQGKQVTIAVTEAWAKSHIDNDPAKQNHLSKALGEALGTKVSVKIVLVDATSSSEHDIMLDDPIIKEQLETGAILIEEREGEE